LAVYTVPLTGSGLPVVPAKINTDLPAPFPFVQLIVLLVVAVLVKVILIAWVVGGFEGVVTLAGSVPFVVVKYCGLPLVFSSTTITW